MPSGVYKRTEKHLAAMRAQRLGKKATPETRAKMSAAMKGHTVSLEQREKIRASLTGRKRPPEVIAKVSASLKGRPLSAEHRASISAANAGRFKGDEHHAWKGDEVSYWGLHSWLKKNFPKTGVCDDCGVVAGSRAHDYASVGHTYTRDRNDWRELCRKCHKKLDRN